MNNEKQKHIQKYVQETNHFRDQFEPQQLQQQQPQFYLHGETQSPQQQQQLQQLQQQQQQQNPPTPQVPARRTWSQKPPPEMSTWSQQVQIQQQNQQQPTQQQNKFETMTMPSWKASPISVQQVQQQPQSQQPTSGFVLHKQNGREPPNSEAQRLFPVVHATPPKPNVSSLRPSTDDMMMAPQSISFIGDEADEDVDEGDHYQHNNHPIPRKNGSSIKKSFDQIDEFEASLGKLNITSGSRTYRIPSPTTRQGIADSSFQSLESQNENEKGFYISFDTDSQPKRPKPPLRMKRSPKKSSDEFDNGQSMADTTQEVFSKKVFEMQETQKPIHNESIKSKHIEHDDQYQYHQQQQQQQQPRQDHYMPQPQQRLSSTVPKENQAIVITDDKNFDHVRFFVN